MALFNTDRLNRSERKKLRKLRKTTKGLGFGKKSHSGLTAAQSREKRTLEGKRRKARGEDFGKAVIGAAAGGLGAALGGGPALAKLAGKAKTGISKLGSKLGGEAGKQALIDAGKKKLQDFTKKAIARKAGDIASSVNTGQLPQANPRATEDTRVEGLMSRLQGMDGPLELEDIPLEGESFDDPSSLELALDNPSFAEFGSEGVDEFPTRPPRGMGMEAVLADIDKKNTLSGLEDIPLGEESFPEDETFGQIKGLSTDAIRKLSPSASNINKLTRLMQQKKDQGRSELDAVGELDDITTGGLSYDAEEALQRRLARGKGRGSMPKIDASQIFNQVTGGRDRLTSGNKNVQGRMDDFMKMLGGFNQSRGLAGLGNTFRMGGRMKVKKKY